MQNGGIYFILRKTNINGVGRFNFELYNITFKIAEREFFIFVIPNFSVKKRLL